jgi:hypothetical protein
VLRSLELGTERIRIEEIEETVVKDERRRVVCTRRAKKTKKKSSNQLHTCMYSTCYPSKPPS